MAQDPSHTLFVPSLVSATMAEPVVAPKVRTGFFIHNLNEEFNLYVKLGPGASLTSAMMRITPGQFIPLPLLRGGYLYSKLISGVWDGEGGNGALVTEVYE